MHMRISPADGQCRCDASRDWVSTGDSSFDCKCTASFLSEDGECLDCWGAMPGCTRCDKVAELDDTSFKLAGFRNAGHFNENGVQDGVYRCSSCSMDTLYYNHDTKECESCAKAIAGCKECKGKEGVCFECSHGYATSAGRCYDCTRHHSRCDNCNTSRCHDC